jgi:hypothetical protein
MPSHRIPLLLAAIFCSVPWSARAQSYLSPDPPPHAVEDRLRLEVDVLYGGYDTTLRVGDSSAAASAPGTEFSAEDDLGLSKAQVLGQIELTLLPGQNHLVRFNALTMRRDAQHRINRSISIDDQDFVANDLIDSRLNISLYGLTYGYFPFRTDRFELAGTFGIQIASVNANAVVRSRPAVAREADSGVAPLPLFGVEGRFDFTRRWSVDGRIQYFGLVLVRGAGANVDDDASIMDGRVAVRWRHNQHFIYGLGYRYFAVQGESRDAERDKIELKLSGPIVFVQGSL